MRSRLILCFCLGLGAASWSCTFDSSNPCGEHQRLNDDGLCECTDDTVLVDGECEACGKHERAQQGSCVCEEGYMRGDPTQPCVRPSTGLGDACESDSDCGSESNALCYQAEADEGYCTTSGCESTDDCEGGFACNTTEEPAFCQRPPTGQGQPCESDAECEGTEATFCDSFISNQCLVPDCDPENNDCFSGWECCDLNSLGFGTLCVPEGSCTL